MWLKWGVGVTLGAGGHQCTAAKLMPVFFFSLFCSDRKAECGGSLTETSKHTEGKLNLSIGTIMCFTKKMIRNIQTWPRLNG